MADHLNMQGERARAFNLGSDAYIRGATLEANPYDKAKAFKCWRNWRRGWYDVYRNRKAFKNLPEPIWRQGQKLKKSTKKDE